MWDVDIDATVSYVFKGVCVYYGKGHDDLAPSTHVVRLFPRHVIIQRAPLRIHD